MASKHEKQKPRKVNTGKSSPADQRQPAKGADHRPTGKVSLRLQQQCLDIFRNALNPSAEDVATLQEVKGHLFDRNFAAAFSNESYLRVYASRWSPSRALAYLGIFSDILPSLEARVDCDKERRLSVLSVGGGAGGELVALVGWLACVTPETSRASPAGIAVSLMDIADWTEIINALREAIITPPELSKYASQAKKDANRALVDPNDLTVSFQQQDVLDTDDASVKLIEASLARADIVTFMFTLNELYSTSLSKTKDLLSRITNAACQGTLLLVVDSPGSYSTVSLNGTEKRYPMQWLLDYTLLGPSEPGNSNSNTAKWEKLIDDSSRWFRLPSGLQYPIELENMRHQIHLYRRLDDRE